MRLLEKVCNQPWLITPEALETIVGVVTREHLDPALAEQIRLARAERPAALAMRGGTPLAGAEGVSLRDGVAHLAVVGPITRYADIFSYVSGLASVEQVAANFQAALDAPDVRAILLELDTPGGEVTGVAALGEAIFAARGRKPVWAYVDGMAASAGYWLASGAQRIVTDPAGMLGSIGAVLAVRDPAKAPTAGRSIEFISSQSPHKRANPTTDDGRAQYQRIVDQTAEAFIEAVARNRGVSVDDVVAHYGAGGLLVGRHAVEAGLADQVGTFETTLAALAAQTNARPGRNGGNPTMWKEFWGGLFGAAQAAGALPPSPTASDGSPTEAVAASLVTATAVAPAAPTTPATDDAAARIQAAEARAAEAEEARKQAEAILAKSREDQQASAVTTLVEGAIASGKAFPAEREALSALATRAYAGGFGVELEALIAARPAHQLSAELVAATPASALPLARPTAGDGQPMSAERRRELLAATPEGRAVLAREK